MTVIVLHRVWPALIASTEWYEMEKNNLGGEFLGAADDAIDRIGEFPLRYPVVFRDARRAQVDRFPFGVFYVIRREKAYVFSIEHLHRNPRRWQRMIPPRRGPII